MTSEPASRLPDPKYAQVDTKALEARLRFRAETRENDFLGRKDTMEWQAADTVATLRQERDEARSGNRYAQLEALAIRRAEAAEAEASTLRKKKNALRNTLDVNARLSAESESETATLRQKLERAEAGHAFMKAAYAGLAERANMTNRHLTDALALLAETGKVLETTQKALEHASFALDGVVANDDEDEGKDGGSDTCQHAKKTVDSALKKVVAISAKIKDATDAS